VAAGLTLAGLMAPNGASLLTAQAAPTSYAALKLAPSLDKAGVSFPQKSHQLIVTPTPDTKAASTEVVSSASGATLSATGADGTRFTFHIPPDALLSDETVTLTPVSALHGSPLGSLVGAVSVTPDGLELNKQGTLTITPGHPAPAQAGFVAAFGGRDFSLYPLGTPGRRRWWPRTAEARPR